MRLCLILIATALVGCGTEPEPAVEWPEAPNHLTGDVAAVDWYFYLAMKRRAHLSLLKRYIDRGEFPINDDFPDRRMPYFVDHQDTACAVAHLMRKEGRGEDVKFVSESNNHVLISDVTEGPVMDWMLYSGFTKGECALIQPLYPPKSEPTDVIRDHLNKVHEILTRDTQRGLHLALEELLPRLVDEGRMSPTGFTLIAPGPRERRIENPGAVRIYARVSFLDVNGIWTQRGDLLSVGAAEVRSFQAPERTAYCFVEWQRPPRYRHAILTVRS